MSHQSVPPFDSDALVSHLLDRFNHDLRIVGYAREREESNLLYVRDDLEERVTEDRVASIVDEFLMESMSSDIALEELGYGDRRAMIEDFENVEAVFVNIDQFEGVVFVVDGNLFRKDNDVIDSILSIVTSQ